ncbi:50S ribosomal protein L4 [Sporomusa sp.]|jgi:large subunit ribosomal protein L4|uniref:50S ribosomal protein L4 n=1 Tax=Sporomusa sp. TaxID=2078658 RepID=UPI002CCEC8BB|nr:50S ribosomal protein L4 [Sporomusa sp.]HWR09836.1 50S ribosomal protein L4 [Sporomusa sp.]
MPKVAVYDMTGAKTGEIELNDSVFGVEINEAVVHQAVVMQLASQRHGTHATKTRAMVRGGGRKPWKQKGTGRARAGSIRSPLWVGGGVAFGPHPRSYKFSMPRKVRRLAIKSALTAKVNDGGLLVVEDINFAVPKTKDVVKFLGNFEASDNKALIITVDQNDNVVKSSRNIPGVKAINTMGLNVFDLLHHDKVLVTKDAIAKIEEVLA